MRCSRVDVCESWRLRSVTSCLAMRSDATTQPSRRPGPSVLENVLTCTTWSEVLNTPASTVVAPEAQLAVRVVGEDDEAVALGQLDQPDAVRGGQRALRRVVEVGHRVQGGGPGAGAQLLLELVDVEAGGADAARAGCGRRTSSSARRNSGKIGLSTATRPPRSTSESTASDRPWNPPLVMMTRSTGTPSRAAIHDAQLVEAGGLGVLERGRPRAGARQHPLGRGQQRADGQRGVVGDPAEQLDVTLAAAAQAGVAEALGLAERAGEGGDRGQGRQQVWCRRHRFCLPGGARLVCARTGRNVGRGPGRVNGTSAAVSLVGLARLDTWSRGRDVSGNC